MSELSTTAVARQDASVPHDVGCMNCGYNLRGQRSEWDRAQSRWRCTCPECGNAQTITLTADSQMNAPMLAIGVAMGLIGLYVAWTLLCWLAAGEASLMTSPTATTLNATVAIARGTAVGSANSAVLSADLLTILTHVGVHAIRVALAAAAVGILIGCAPHANGRQRLILLALSVVGACVAGVWMNLSGYQPDSGDSVARYLQMVASLNSTRGVPSTAIDWQWKFVSGLSGLLIAFVAARGGQAAGLPLQRLLVSMYLSPDVRARLAR